MVLTVRNVAKGHKSRFMITILQFRFKVRFTVVVCINLDQTTRNISIGLRPKPWNFYVSDVIRVGFGLRLRLLNQVSRKNTKIYLLMILLKKHLTSNIKLANYVYLGKSNISKTVNTINYRQIVKIKRKGSTIRYLILRWYKFN